MHDNGTSLFLFRRYSLSDAYSMLDLGQETLCSSVLLSHHVLQDTE